MGGNSCPLGKYWLLILTGSGFHLHHIISFLFIFFCPGQLFLHQEMDGSVSALLLTGELEARQFSFTFGFVLVQGLNTACAPKKKQKNPNNQPQKNNNKKTSPKKMALGETFLLWLKMEKDPGELWSVMGWVRVAGFLQLQPLKCKCELMMGIVSFNDSRGLMWCQHICFNCYLLILTV